MHVLLLFHLGNWKQSNKSNQLGTILFTMLRLVSMHFFFLKSICNNGWSPIQMHLFTFLLSGS